MSMRMCPLFFPPHFRKMNKFIPTLIFPLFIFASCNSTSPEKAKGDAINDEYERMEENMPTAETIAYDSIAEKEHIDTESAAICLEFSRLVEKLEEVKSPDGLISAKKEYAAALSALNGQMNTLNDKDKTAVLNYKKEAEAAYAQACKNYEIPASGVIANLNNLIRRIDQVKTKEELDRFQSSRLGMLRGLDDIYLCVEHNSPQISEVKRLAQSLKSKYSSKRHEFGLE